MSSLTVESAPSPRKKLFRMLPTAIVLAAAIAAIWWIWITYVTSPWTRDGTVRAYVLTVTPQVSGRVVDVAVTADQFVKKGDLLMVIDPKDYEIEVASSEAAVTIAQSDLDNKQAEAARRVKLNGLAISQETEQSALTAANIAAATLKQARASLDRSKLDLERTRILAPVDGYVTNLAIQSGDYATSGQRALSVVDSGSFWVDAYFEETLVGNIMKGNHATIKLMAYPQVLSGRVVGVGRGISVPNATDDAAGLPTVNPVFTWVRLAQRVPVRIELTPAATAGIRLTAGMTATVSIAN